MDRVEVVKAVADELFATEQAVDAAIIQATGLVTKMIEGRAAAKLSPVVGAEAQAKVMAAVAALGEAREAVVAAHGELAKTHRKVGLGVYAAGPLDKPDDHTIPVGGSADRVLRVAASR